MSWVKYVCMHGGMGVCVYVRHVKYAAFVMYVMYVCMYVCM